MKNNPFNAGGGDQLELSLDNYFIRSYYSYVKEKSATKPAGQQETVARLLDAAERLFAEHGFHGVGMRQLADEAKVNLGAATYHFGSKETLFVETFMRRFRPTNAERSRLLREAEAATGGKPLPVEKIVECMIRPPFESGLAHPAFHLLLARNLFKPPPFLHAAMHKELAPNMEVFIAAFRRALPKLPEDLIHLRTMLGMGGVTAEGKDKSTLRMEYVLVDRSLCTS